MMTNFFSVRGFGHPVFMKTYFGHPVIKILAKTLPVSLVILYHIVLYYYSSSSVLVSFILESYIKVKP